MSSSGSNATWDREAAAGGTWSGLRIGDIDLHVSSLSFAVVTCRGAVCSGERQPDTIDSASAPLFDASALSSWMELGLVFELTTGRESCRLSDAGFSRIPNWRRRCMRCYFNSSWNASSFLVGSEDLVCWPESQDWNSLSFWQTCFSASVTTCEGEQSRNSAYFVSFILASSSSRN